MKKNYHIYPIIGAILILMIGMVVSCRKVVPDAEQDLPAFSHNFRSGSMRKDSSGTDSAAKKQDSINKKQDSLIKKQDSLAKKQDSVAKKDTSAPVAQVPYPQTPPVNACLAVPIYGDTIVFPQPTTGSDYIVHPVNSPGAGKYFSWPVGLVLDSLTGAIDVTKSETGLKFAIGFVKSGTKDTCLQRLVLGGISYEDSVYVLDQGQTKAVPYYDANPYIPAVCSGQGSGCTFDVTGSAAAQKVVVDKNTGVIDLQKTLNGGLLGGAFGLLPQDGHSITTTIYYRVNDASNNALQHIDVQLAYFSHKSLISQGVLGGIVGALNNLLSGNLISTSVNPRPPLVIIASHN